MGQRGIELDHNLSIEKNSRLLMVLFDLMLLFVLVLLNGCCTNPRYLKTETENSILRPIDISFSNAESGLPNIVIISIDTLRSDHLSSYGHSNPTSPFLDKVGRNGITFSTAVSQSPWTFPSHHSLFTGMYVSHHGLMTYFNKPATEYPTLAEVLQRNGYATAAFTGGAAMSREMGFARGFAVFETPGTDLDKTSVAAIAFIEDFTRNRNDEGMSQPFFLFLHGFDPHAPYVSTYSPPEMFEEDYEEDFIDPGYIPIYAMLNDSVNLGFYLSQYDSCIRSADHYLQRLWVRMAELGLSENTLFIILSDHGEGFMDKGSFDHTFLSLYECDIKTPLIITGPDIPKGIIIDCPVQNIDIFPWLMDYLHFDEPIETDGISLFSSQRKNFPVISENFFLHNLLVESDTVYLVENRVRIWPGTIRSLKTNRSLEDSLKMEFGSDFANSQIQENNKMNFTFGFTDMEISFCNSSGMDDACFLMLEYLGYPDELKEEMETLIEYEHHCWNDEECRKIKEEFRVVTSGECFSIIPEAVAIPCSLNERSIRLLNWKLKHDLGNGSFELFDLDMDPGETTNVSETYPEIAEQLLIRLQRKFADADYAGEIRSVDELDQNTRDALQALGYIQNSD